MNNEQHPLDDLFKQRLEHAAAPVPDDMWGRIARVRQQQRRRVIAWWSVAAVTAVLAVGSMFVFWPTPSTGVTSAPTPTAAPAVETVPSHNSAVATAPTTTDAASTPASAAATPAHNSSVSTTTRNEHYAIKVAPAAPTSKALTATPAATETPHAATTTTSATPTDMPDEVAHEAITSTPAETTTPLTTITTTDEAAEAPADPATGDLLRVSGPHQRERLLAVAQLPGRDFFQAAPIDIKLLASHATRCANFDTPAFHWDVELLAGPAYAQSQLAAKATEGQTHLKRRLETEAPGLSYNTAVRIGVTSKTGLGLKTGLQYSQINDRFTYYVGRRMDVSVIFGPNGEVIGSDTTYTEGRNETRSNRLQFVEVPLLLGFEQRVGQFRVGINAGAFLNLHFNASGYIYSPVGEDPVAFGQEGDRNVLPIFRQDATASWYTGLSVAYNLHGRYSLMAEPYFRAFPRTLSSTGYALSQRYWMTGLQLGLRVRL